MTEGDEPRPPGVRIGALAPEDRAVVAQYRVGAVAELLKASGCAVQFDLKRLVVDFHTGRHAMLIHVDGADPRRIKLMMAFMQPGGDIVRARWACFEATAKQFASKATVDEQGSALLVVLSIGVYAEALHAFGDSLKAYVEDLEKLYEDWLDLMLLED